jgi:hypothetical protein
MSSQWLIGERGPSYIDFVWEAITSEAAFSRFRCDPRYTPILEHVSVQQGKEYLDLIRDDTIRRICMDSEFADTIGAPAVAVFDGRKLSPTTLRYGKVLQDLVDAFPRLHDFHSVVEIGVGYGGQARLVSEYVRHKRGRMRSYCLVDLLPVLHLSRLYLEHFSLMFEAAYHTRSTLPRAASYDLAISNYAFSEFNRELQSDYVERTLQRSLRGYLTMNSGLYESEQENRHTAKELLGTLPAALVADENPKTGPDNYVLIFGTSGGNSPSMQALKGRAVI